MIFIVQAVIQGIYPCWRGNPFASLMLNNLGKYRPIRC